MLYGYDHLNMLNGNAHQLIDIYTAIHMNKKKAAFPILH